MRLLKIVLLVLCLISLTCQVRQDQVNHFNYNDAYKYILSTINGDSKRQSSRYQRWRDMGEKQREYTAGRIASVSTNVCDIYQLDLKIFIKHMERESRFRYWAVSHRGAIGLMQVQPYWHSGKLYKIENGDLGRHLLKRKREGKLICHERYFKRIGYNLRVAGYLYRMWLDKYEQKYSFMLASYFNGHNNSWSRKLRAKPELLYNVECRLFRDIRRIINE